MLKAVEKLIRDYKAGKKKATYGNHWMVVTNLGVKFYYHNTAICVVDNAGTVTYDNGGWNTSSTSRALSSYASYFGGDWRKQVGKE